MALNSQAVVFISAQDLKPPSSSSANIRRLKTYAIVWVDPSTKLRTLVDRVGGRRLKTYAIVWVDPSTKLRTLVERVGGENPIWNEKFLLRVPSGFLASDSSSAVHIEIYVVGRLVDSLVGAVDFLVGNRRLLSKPLGHPRPALVRRHRDPPPLRPVPRSAQHGHGAPAAQPCLISGRRRAHQQGVDAIGHRAHMDANFSNHKILKGSLDHPSERSWIPGS